jgi:hypothetical protein
LSAYPPRSCRSCCITGCFVPLPACLAPLPLQGKFLLWDEDNVVTSSLNWGSASSDPDFPLGDIGVHIRAAGIGESVYQRLVSIFPKLQDELPVGGVAA